jgi:hypothetical protein
MATVADVLSALCVGGLMGVVGQGARTIVGLKGMVDEAKEKNLGQDDVFRASRLVFSLLLGFLIGIIAAITLGVDEIIKDPTGNLRTLIGIAGAGYAGTDFLEGFIANYLPGSGSSKAPATIASDASSFAVKSVAWVNSGALALKVHADKAKQMAYAVIKEHDSTATNIKDDDPLTKYNLGGPKELVYIADKIYSTYKIYVNAAVILKCTTVADLVSAIEGGSVGTDSILA